MPKGIYERNEYHNKINSDSHKEQISWNKNKKMSKEFCDKIRKANKEGRCGMKNKNHSKETKKKIGQANSISHKGIKLSKLHREKIREGRLKLKEKQGYLLSKKTREKCRQNALNQFRYGMPEKTKEKLKKYVGKLASGWRGGKSFEPYGIKFNNQLKEKIRKRDGYKCQECNFTEKQLGYKLSVHHIDYNKRNNIMKNLISLCRNCHSQTNFKRKNWIEYFKIKFVDLSAIS